ncbi:MAG: four helix bundle protein [Desulfobaccales bacterium]
MWKLSIDLAGKPHKLTSKFPPSENFGLTNQMRRAAVSIPANIAAGQGRNAAKEFKQFLAIKLGSLAELEVSSLRGRRLHKVVSIERNPFSFLAKSKILNQGIVKG